MEKVNADKQKLTLLSEKDKKERGFDLPSFAKRMSIRLKKIQGADSDNSDIFLTRHKYELRTCSQ